MPRPTKGPRLGSGPTHQKLMLGGLASQLIMHERIRTTETKAKRLRPVADRLVSLGKQGSVHARRRALSLIEDREVIHKLFADVAPRFADRNGGYTRVLKLGPRQGDAAPMAIIEFVEGSFPAAQPEADQKRRRGLRRRKPAKPASESEQRPPDSAERADGEGATDIEEEPGLLQGAPGDDGGQADEPTPETPQSELEGKADAGEPGKGESENAGPSSEAPDKPEGTSGQDG